MAISPDPDDTRLHRFPKDWFKLPWQERNQKFNELINIELERAKKYLNELPKVKDEYNSSNEMQISSRQSARSINTFPLTYPEICENPEKVDANDLIKELDLLIKAGEKVKEKLQGSDSVIRHVKKKKKHNPKKTKVKKELDQEKKEEEVEVEIHSVKSVKSLEEHLRVFLGTDEPHPFNCDQQDSPRSPQSHRPPERIGYCCGSELQIRAVSGEELSTQPNDTYTPPLSGPASAPLPCSTLFSESNLVSRTLPNSSSPSHANPASQSGPISPTKPRRRRRPPRVPHPRPTPARLPPIPQCLVPVVTLSIDDPQEHARTLLARGPRTTSSSGLPSNPHLGGTLSGGPPILKPHEAPLSINHCAPSALRCDARRPLPPLQRRHVTSQGATETLNPHQKRKTAYSITPFNLLF